MAASNTELIEDRKLSDIFEEAFNLYNSFEKCYLPTNSTEFQLDIKKCMRLFEDATRLVSLIGLFSTNESYEEISTKNLKYLLLPYFLGQLSLKICSGERRDIIDVAEVYYKDFLNRCEEYGLHKPNHQSTVATIDPQLQAMDKFAELTQMAHQRNTKMEQYRQKKELDDEIQKIKILMAREHIDETIKRDFYIKLLKSSLLDCQDDLRSIYQEAQILEHMSRMRLENPDFDAHQSAAPKRPSQPLKPIIITKNDVQKAIYGAGYPSLPTMSVNDFYENRVKEGIFPDPNVVRDPNSLQARAMRGEKTELDEQEEEKKERDEENDDEEYLARARGMDEFRDEVRRGDGNRHNRS